MPFSQVNPYPGVCPIDNHPAPIYPQNAALNSHQPFEHTRIRPWVFAQCELCKFQLQGERIDTWLLTWCELCEFQMWGYRSYIQSYSGCLFRLLPASQSHCHWNCQQINSASMICIPPVLIWHPLWLILRCKPSTRVNCSIKVRLSLDYDSLTLSTSCGDLRGNWRFLWGLPEKHMAIIITSYLTKQIVMLTNTPTFLWVCHGFDGTTTLLKNHKFPETHMMQ